MIDRVKALSIAQMEQYQNSKGPTPDDFVDKLEIIMSNQSIAALIVHANLLKEQKELLEKDDAKLADQEQIDALNEKIQE